MYLKNLIFILLLSLSTTSFASEVVLPPDLQNVKTISFDPSENFEVYAVDYAAGKLAAVNVEKIKTWVNRRWNLPDIAFKHKCVLYLIQDEESFKKWVRGQTEPKLTKARDRDNNERDVYAIWTNSFNGENPEEWINVNLRGPISKICTLNYQETFGVEIDRVLRTGMSVLDSDIEVIRSLIANLDPNANYDIMTLLENDTDDSNAYKAKCAAFCLLLKKQQDGSKKFPIFLDKLSKTQNMADALSVYGFTSIKQFDMSYHTYVRNLIVDLRKGTTPKMGLTWFVPKEETKR